MFNRTLDVHAGRAHLAQQGVHVPGIDLSTTYPLHDAAAGTASIDAWANGDGTAQNPVYARLHNPTVAGFEAGLAELEEAETAVAFASGMAATTGLLLSRQGHVVAVRPMYGGTDHLLSSGLLGHEVTWVEADGVAEAIRPDTSLVWIETPANPTLQMVDIAEVVAQAGDVPVVVDNTFATPVLQKPLRLGARFVLHSATKFLGGHGDVLGGVVACSEADAKALRQVRVITGANLHPLAGYLLHRGLQTLTLRVRAAQANALILARRLQNHPGVRVVHYPGLPGTDPKGLVGRQMVGPGCVLAFDVGTMNRARAVMEAVQLATPAVSLGAVDTLIQHPASLTHRVVEDEAKQLGGVTAGLLRLSVGIEELEDLWADLDRALSTLELAAAAK
ncbi:MAG: cystathionine gamma-synthase [Deltaproteobacteria bacterium]|nr:cystathionine gamma-synthase [Deltaproteobacteria bacterium]HCH62602.1 cystathionine gamma-synthase [Deltaproteobacteria bacterium]